jgi:hypothetical protein
MILQDVDKYYESMIPIVLILDSKDIKEYELALKKNKYRYKIGIE